jgi:hypothetical protein
MPRQVQVEIEGNHISNVLHVEYGVDVARDSNGAPTDAFPRLKTITIVRRSDGNSDMWRWALHPHQGNFKSGKVTFKDPLQENQDLITLEWTNGFVRSYTEVVPHVHQNQREPMTEQIEVAAQMVKINDVEWEANYKGRV